MGAGWTALMQKANPKTEQKKNEEIKMTDNEALTVDNPDAEAIRDFDIMLDEHTSVSMLRKLFQKHFDPDNAMSCLAAIDHPKCSSDLMEYVAGHANGDVKYCVLGGLNLPSITALEILLRNDFEQSTVKILEALGEGRELSNKLASEMQASSFEVLRLCVVSNPYTTASRCFINAATDEAVSVRLACAKHDSCPRKALEVLITDIDPKVRAAASRNQNLKLASVKKYFMDPDFNVRLGYIKRDDCPIRAIEYYFNEGADEAIKAAMAAHQHCPANILSSLASDASWKVRVKVALNERTLEPTIKALTMDPVPAVRSAAGFHPNCPEDRFQYAFKIPNVNYPPDSGNSDLLAKIQSIKDSYSKCIDENEELIEDLMCRHKRISNISLAYDFEYFLAPPDYVDRTRGMLAGPFYTSQKYPWPRTKKNMLAEPIIQIDLDEVSYIRDKSYGTGLLQVFADDIDLVTRNVPRSEIDAEEITVCEWEFFVDDETSFYQFVESLNHQISIYQIVGYKIPYVSSGVEVDQWDNEDLSSEFFKLNELLNEAGDTSHGNHLFGSFHEIQTRPCDGELFVALDEADGYVWGDSGNAQIFVKEDKDGFKYSGQWSCY